MLQIGRWPRRVSNRESTAVEAFHDSGYGSVFAAEERDNESGLDYLRGKYSDPEVGRFLGQDPLGEGYPYTGNNSVNRTEPTGLYYIGGYDEAWGGIIEFDSTEVGLSPCDIYGHCYIWSTSGRIELDPADFAPAAYARDRLRPWQGVRFAGQAANYCLLTGGRLWNDAEVRLMLDAVRDDFVVRLRSGDKLMAADRVVLYKILAESREAAGPE